MPRHLEDRIQGMSNRVYSTEHGQICRACQQPQDRCQCQTNRRQQVLGDGRVRISRETKGRKGKGVTLIRGLAMNANELDQLGRQLKQLCGSGGAVKQDTIEIQGDHREKVMAFLQQRGIDAKLSGG